MVKLTPSQQLMVDDGCPLICIATLANEKRSAEAWRRSPPRAMPVFEFVNRTRDESPETAAFRAAEEERKRQKSLAGIQRMKNRFASKAIDYSKMRWDARRGKFVEDAARAPASAQENVVRIPRQTKHSNWNTRRARDEKVDRVAKADAEGWSRLTKDNAEAVAKLNGVWKDSYEKLRGTGRIVMTVGNVLKGIAKRRGTVKWQ